MKTATTVWGEKVTHVDERPREKRVGFHEGEEGCGEFRPGFGNTIKTKSRATLKMPVCDTHTKDFTRAHSFGRCWNFAVCACLEVQRPWRTDRGHKGECLLLIWNHFLTWLNLEYTLTSAKALDSSVTWVNFDFFRLMRKSKWVSVHWQNDRPWNIV